MIENLNKVKSPTYSILFALTLSSNGFFLGFNVGLLNTFGNFFLESVFNITDPEEQKNVKSTMNFLFILGGFVACFFSSAIYETLGRYKSLLIFLVLNILFTLLGLTKVLYLVYAFRFLCGFNGVFWTILAPLFIKEVTPPKYRKFIDNSFYVFLTGAILLSYTFKDDFARNYWYLIILVPVMVDVPKILLHLFVFRQESPESLYKRYKDQELLEERLVSIY